LEGNKDKELLYLDNEILTNLSDGNTASTNNPTLGRSSRLSSSINLENKPGVEEKNFIPDFNFDFTDPDNN
jgi:hypothetical protein